MGIFRRQFVLRDDSVSTFSSNPRNEAPTAVGYEWTLRPLYILFSETSRSVSCGRGLCASRGQKKIIEKGDGDNNFFGLICF